MGGSRMADTTAARLRRWLPFAFTADQAYALVATCRSRVHHVRCDRLALTYAEIFDSWC